MNTTINIFLTRRFYLVSLATVLLFILGHFSNLLFVLGKLALITFTGLFVIDVFLVLQGKITANRTVAERFSNGDYNNVEYAISNKYAFRVKLEIIDEFPEQFQLRNFAKVKWFKPNEEWKFACKLRPVKRGVYEFGYLQIFVSSYFGMVQNKITLSKPVQVAVYPSFQQLKKTEMMAFSMHNNQDAKQKLQKPGNSKEFEQIKEYVSGDDYRKINWKATARMNKHMVNEYQEERSRHIYQLIDLGRTMKMPFEGMTLLDYAINASLSLANVILKKHDKTGLFTYSSIVHSIIKSNNRKLQLNTILETLYAQKTKFNESSLEQVYASLQKNTKGRSLLIFYTNFESNQGLDRQLPLLKKLANNHLVLLVTFVNTEIEKLAHSKAMNTEQVYKRALAENHLIQKQLLMEKLNKLGILHINVRPNELTISVINKYLEIKDRGII